MHNSYEFSRFCQSQNYGDDGNNRDEHLTIYKGSWDGTTGKATEYVDDEFRYFYKGQQSNLQHYTKTLTADCPADPWLYDVSCSNPATSPPLPLYWTFYPPYPLSAELLEDSVRKYYRNEYLNLVRKKPPRSFCPNRTRNTATGR